MLAHDLVVLGADAQADVLVHDARHHRHQHRGIVDVLGIGRDRAGQRLLLLAAGLVALVEHMLELRVVLEHAGIEMPGQRNAMRLENGSRAFDQGADLGTQHLLLLVARSESPLNMHL